MHPVLKPLARDSEGRRGPFFLSRGRVSRGGSGKGSESGREGIGDMEVSTGVRSGVGDCSCSPTTVNGALCGRGDISMSIASMTPGEEEGTGGVFTFTGIRVSIGQTCAPGKHTTVATSKHVIREECSPWCWQLWTKKRSACTLDMPVDRHTSDRCGSSARGRQPGSLLAKSLVRVSC